MFRQVTEVTERFKKYLEELDLLGTVIIKYFPVGNNVNKISPWFFPKAKQELMFGGSIWAFKPEEGPLLTVLLGGMKLFVPSSISGRSNWIFAGLLVPSEYRNVFVSFLQGSSES